MRPISGENRQGEDGEEDGEREVWAHGWDLTARGFWRKAKLSRQLLGPFLALPCLTVWLQSRRVQPPSRVLQRAALLGRAAGGLASAGWQLRVGDARGLVEKQQFELVQQFTENFPYLSSNRTPNPMVPSLPKVGYSTIEGGGESSTKVAWTFLTPPLI